MSKKAILASILINRAAQGATFVWGKGTNGGLGLGDVLTLSSPVQLGALTDWVSWTGGGNFMVAVKGDGSLWSQGDGGSGMTGHSNTTNYCSPVQVGALTNWAQASSGVESTLVVKTDGSLWGFGKSTLGVLGNGSTSTEVSSPVQIGALTNWAQVATHGNHTLAVKTDGTLWAWGENSAGELGLGNTTGYSSPVQVGALTTWVIVKTGLNHTVAVTTAGTLFAWGLNDNGQLGLGNTTNICSPVQVGALTTWLTPSAGDIHTTHCIKTDGTLWGWGENGKGQIGNAATTDLCSPVQVGALTTWTHITKEDSNKSFGRTSDGKIWSWGDDYKKYLGQLGAASSPTNYVSSPVQIGSATDWASIWSDAGKHFAAVKL